MTDSFNVDRFFPARPLFVAWPHTEDWKVARLTGIGSSEAGAVCGLSPYSTPLEVYSRKVGDLPDVEDSELTRFGRVMEPAILRLYMETCRFDGDPIYPLPMVRDREHPFSLSTSDALLGNVLLEIKSMDWRIARKIDEVGLHAAVPDYVCQVQDQMGVTGLGHARIVALVNRGIRTWNIERHDRLIALIRERKAELWDRIMRRDPPPMQYTHPSAMELVRALHPSIKWGVVRLSDTARDDQAQYERLSAAIKSCEESQKAIRARQLAEIGDFEGGLVSDDKILRRSIVSRKEYTVPAKEYPTCRVVKYNGEPIVKGIDDGAEANDPASAFADFGLTPNAGGETEDAEGLD